MKCTLKIKLSERHDGNVPVIKIVKPLSLNDDRYDPSVDIDVNDTLIDNFLQTPSTDGRNRWFRLGGFYNTPYENPTHHISTIEPVNDFKDLMEGIRGEVLNKLIPYKELTNMHESVGTTDKNRPVSSYYDSYKRIIDFFEWAIQEPWVTPEERETPA